ncbi:MAG: hypothetical protein E6I65_04690 [Chloroflexi bacterium]|nr:MAG: hypothetical protein E6I65_04690 [Chloroflexota bacterium]
MNLFIVDLKHQPGELAKATEAIAQKGIDITAFSGVTCGGSGTIALLTSDDAGTRRALTDAGYHPREVEVVTTTIPNTPGSLAATARKLANAGVNVEVALPTSMAEGKVTLAWATDQPAKTRGVLGAAEPVGVGSR